MTYTAIMDNYTQENKLDTALEWYQKMLAKGIKPSVGSYNSLITIYGMKHSIEKVLEVFNEMEKIGIRINKTSYEVITPIFQYSFLILPLGLI
jgi:pentatricopeptide repeat protein